MEKAVVEKLKNCLKVKMKIISVTLLAMAVVLVSANDMNITVTLGQDFDATEGTLFAKLLDVKLDGGNWTTTITDKNIKLEPGIEWKKAFTDIQKKGFNRRMRWLSGLSFWWEAKDEKSKQQIRLDKIQVDLNGTDGKFRWNTRNSFCIYRPSQQSFFYKDFSLIKSGIQNEVQPTRCS